MAGPTGLVSPSGQPQIEWYKGIPQIGGSGLESLRDGWKQETHLQAILSDRGEPQQIDHKKMTKAADCLMDKTKLMFDRSQTVELTLEADPHSSISWKSDSRPMDTSRASSYKFTEPPICSYQFSR